MGEEEPLDRQQRMWWALDSLPGLLLLLLLLWLQRKFLEFLNAFMIPHPKDVVLAFFTAGGNRLPMSI
jgi:ABC-type nitrate/sulfonate/bicarbonate transport system permease component